MTRGNLGILQTLDLEIVKTFRGGVRHNINSSLHFEYFVTLLNTPNFEHFDHYMHSEHTEHSHHYDFDFDTDNMA